MPPDPPRGSCLRRSQELPVPLEVAQFQFSSQLVGCSVPCVFGSCIAYNSNINYLVPVLEVRTPPNENSSLGPGHLTVTRLASLAISDVQPLSFCFTEHVVFN